MSQKNQNAAAAPPDWQTVLHYLLPDGQDEIVAFVNDFKTKHGPAWIEEMQRTYPFAAWVIDLAANRTADEAVDEIAEMFKPLPVRLVVGRHIHALHARLRYEIEVKR